MMEHPNVSHARELSGTTAVIVLTGSAIIIILLAAWFGRTLILLAFAGVLLAVLLRAVTDAMIKYLHLNAAVALALTIIAILGAGTALVLMVAPNVETQSKAVWEQMPATLQQARSQLQQHEWGRRLLTQLPTASGLLSHGAQVVQRSAETIFGALGIIGYTVVIAFVGVYLAIDPRRYCRGAVDLFPPAWRPAIRECLDEAGNCLRRWLLGKFALMIFVGASTSIGLYFLHIPLVTPLALLAAVLDFIPNIGPVLSAVPAVLLALTIGPDHALWTAVLYLAVQVIESYILQPMVQGKAVSLPPAVLISSQVLFGLLLGLPGVILATPLTVVLLVFTRKLYVGSILEPASDRS
jgi:predicted PurR-regulated permease PerM